MNEMIPLPGSEISVQDRFDVVVCGAGPAGMGAALASARMGARTCLVEHRGCLGGVWTAGLLALILDGKNKPGIIAEIRSRLRERGGIAEMRDLYDPEEMKLLLEEMCAEAGVEVRLHSKVAGVDVQGREIRHVILEGKEGRFALGAGCVIDTTGDGDLAALAGCGFDLGREGDGLTQPMSLLALVAGVPEEVRHSNKSASGTASCVAKAEFRRMLIEAGNDPSYAAPSLFPVPNGLCVLMANHAYEKSGLDSRDLTEATLMARREIHATVRAMRKFWPEVRLVATAEAIGVREGRRIHGLYRVTAEDLTKGARFPDGITEVHFPVDVHSVKKAEGGSYSTVNVTTSAEGYEIPLRALIARDADNVAMAGRCLSGDFAAHASYRVTGNAMATGEAAGVLCAMAAREKKALKDVDAGSVLAALRSLRGVAESTGLEPATSAVTGQRSNRLS